MDIKTSLDQLNLWLAEQGVEPRVTFSQEIISEAEIREAEAALGVKLPTAYVQFINRHGVFYISGELTGRGSGNDTALLSPSEMVESTQRYRDEFSGSDEPDAEILDDALIFCMARWMSSSISSWSAVLTQMGR